MAQILSDGRRGVALRATGRRASCAWTARRSVDINVPGCMRACVSVCGCTTCPVPSSPWSVYSCDAAWPDCVIPTAMWLRTTAYQPNEQARKHMNRRAGLHTNNEKNRTPNDTPGPTPHLRRDLRHICAGTYTTSAPGPAPGKRRGAAVAACACVVVGSMLSAQDALWGHSLQRCSSGRRKR